HGSRGLWVASVLIVALLAAGGYGLWGYLKPKPDKKPPDMVAVLEANNRGGGLMERVEYAEAAQAFEKVVEKAPDWLPGRINLGIALLNQNLPATRKRARELFEKILGDHADDPYAHFCLGILLYYEKERAESTKHFEAVTRKDPKDAPAWYWLGQTL